MSHKFNKHETQLEKRRCKTKSVVLEQNVSFEKFSQPSGLPLEKFFEKKHSVSRKKQTEVNFDIFS